MAFLEIRTEDLGKRFSMEWVLRGLDTRFRAGERWALLGVNGSGKSTFIKLICGYMAPSAGNVHWDLGSEVPLERWHRHFSLSAPYLELPEEFNTNELLDFHFSLKKLRSGDLLQKAMLQSGLEAHRNKTIRDYSSGMKQRLKLILSLLSDVPVYLLDEPCSNLDDQGVDFYESMLLELPADALCIIASNDPREFSVAVNYLHL